MNENYLAQILEDNTKTRNHFKCRLRYHIVFSTRYRRKCLPYIEQELYDAFRYCESKSDFTIIIMKQDKDHIHLLIEMKPTYSIGSIIRRIKQMTTNYLYKNNKVKIWLKKFYWHKNEIWTHGYFISTIGQISEQNVYDYIEHQGL